MSRYVDLSERVTAQYYDAEYEEWTQETTTIAEILDSVCDDYTVLPSTQPQRIKGRWKLLPGRDDEHIRYLHCSVCHFNGDYESNFCPNCGADMRGEQDERDS